MPDIYETEAERRARELLAATQPTGGSALPDYGSPEGVTTTSAIGGEPAGPIAPPPGPDVPPPPPPPPPGPDIPPPQDPNMPPPTTTLPGGAIDPAAFQEMFSTAFQPFQQQFTDYQAQQQTGQKSLMDLLAGLQTGQQGIVGNGGQETILARLERLLHGQQGLTTGQQGMTDQFGNVLAGQEGIAGQFGDIGTTDLSGLAGGQQSVMDQLTNLLSGQQGLATGQQGIAGQFGNIPGVDLSGLSEQITGLQSSFGNMPTGPSATDIASAVQGILPAGTDLSGLQGQMQGISEQIAQQPGMMDSHISNLQQMISQIAPGITQQEVMAAIQGATPGMVSELAGAVSPALQTQLGDMQQLIQQQISGIDTGMSPEQLNQAMQTTTESLMNQLQGQQYAGSEQFTALQGQLGNLMNYFQGEGEDTFQGAIGQMGGGAVGEAAQPQQTQFTPEQIANISGGTGEQNQMPGFMYGPDYFRAGTDYMTELAAQAPGADVMGAMGDVLAAGPSSYGELGETLSGRLASPSVYEGELGNEMLGMIRNMGNVDTQPYQQLLSSGMSRIGEEEQRAIDQEMLRFNRMGLTPENVASGTIIDPLSRTRERYAQTRGDLMSQLSLQQGQREDTMRQAQAGAMGGMLGGTQQSRQMGTQGLQNLIGMQQQGQGQSVQGLGGLAQMLQSQQAQQLAGIGGVQQQAWNQNVQDIGLQNMFMQQEQGRRDQLMQQLLGQTQPTMPSIPSIAGPQQSGGGGLGGALGGMAGMLAGSALGPFGSAAGSALGERIFG